MLFSTRPLSLALLLVSALNAAAAPTPTKVPAKAKATAKATTGAPAPSAGGSNPPPRPTAGLENLPDCESCITHNGHFDKVTFTCAAAGASLLNKVTTTVGCAQMLQMQRVFPNAKKGSQVRAGVIPAALNSNFNKMDRHIFVGEATNPDVGRHVLSSFIADHPGLRPTTQNSANKIQVFRLPNKIQTVWDDSQGGYTPIDIKNMCVTAAQILTNARKAGGQFGAVVMSPFGAPACIASVRDVTCFPLAVSSNQPLGAICKAK
jgi:hypothetical protein